MAGRPLEKDALVADAEHKFIPSMGLNLATHMPDQIDGLAPTQVMRQLAVYKIVVQRFKMFAHRTSIVLDGIKRNTNSCSAVVQFDHFTTTVILSGAVFRRSEGSPSQPPHRVSQTALLPATQMGETMPNPPAIAIASSAIATTKSGTCALDTTA